MQILPPEIDFAVRRRPAGASVASLARADAAAFVVDEADVAAALGRLPHAELWRTLHRSVRRAEQAPLLVTRLPNARHTLAAVGLLRDGASAFERLDLAGKLMRELVKPGVATLQCHAALGDPEASAAMLEALASAALAAAAPMPQRKSQPPPAAVLRTIDVHGGRAADLEDAQAVAAGNHLARWLTTLPPNELDCVAYRRALGRLAKREGWAFRFYDEAALRRLGAGAFLAVSRANDHRGAGIVRLTYRPRGGRAWRPHRPGRQGHLLRHRRHQPQGPRRHVPDARRHAGQRRGRRHAAGAGSPQRPLHHRLLARAHRERDRARAPTGRRKWCRR